jgi:hypothetical protein
MDFIEVYKWYPMVVFGDLSTVFIRRFVPGIMYGGLKEFVFILYCHNTNLSKSSHGGKRSRLRIV